jgi:sugar-specific transcriptional regulator TrmB
MHEFYLLTTMVVNNTVDKLKSFGLSEYEARAYLALLGAHPATAYEVAREAGIPTSKIYQAMDKLAGRHMVQTIIEGNKKRYIPIQPDEFVERQKQRIETSLKSLGSDLAQVKKPTGISYIWNVEEYRYLMEKAQRMIDEAKSEILISAWNEELAYLAQSLAAAEKLGVHLALVLFGKSPHSIGTVFHHPIEDTIYQEKGGRGITLIADSQEALAGTIHDRTVVEGAWSMSRGFVILAEDYVKHDIYIMKIVSRFEDILTAKFGKNYRLLRDIFSDKEVRDGK